MIGYATLGTNNFEAALEFYDALFSSVGANRLWKQSDMAAWGCSRAESALCLACPFNGEPASVGNEVIVALKTANRKAVDTLHAKCLELGGTYEGAHGPRGDHGSHGEYFRDLDGNKLNAYFPA